MRLFRSRSTTKLNAAAAQLESQRDENATVVALAQEVSSGARALLSLQPFELSLFQRALRTRRNSLAPISRLPTEVLAPILELCPTIDDDRPHFHTGNFILRLTSAQVCRRWREIALKSSHFWTHIVLSRPRWALEMLHRSRAAPLTVGVALGAATTKTIAARELVLVQLSRIRELHVDVPTPRSLPSALLAPAPLLHKFHLRYQDPDGFLPPALFQGQAPRLRHLSLGYCILEGDSPLWEHLVSLELVNASIDFLLLVLAQMPQLRDLTLNESVPEPAENAEPLVLQLQTLEIRGSCWHCRSFLRGVVLPRCRISLYVTYSNSDLRFLWDALESQRAAAPDPVICGLQFADLPSEADGKSRFGVSFFGRSSTPGIPRYSVILASAPPALPNWREETLCTVMAIVSLDQANALTVSSAVPGLSALKLSASLLHLNFRSAAFHSGVEPFTRQLESDPLMAAPDLVHFDAVTASVHYPCLRKIAFHDVDFTRGSETAVMLDWLAQRRRLNLGIEEIRLVRCKMTSADLGSLGEVVSRVCAEEG
ncbi:hypothetical protein DFH09DRAFT_1038838 [Mycena vulgaris]|nr:hypothetical protein DFH09DRAFT_1038838 [Mycena vulgaris]